MDLKMVRICGQTHGEPHPQVPCHRKRAGRSRSAKTDRPRVRRRKLVNEQRMATGGGGGGGGPPNGNGLPRAMGTCEHLVASHALVGRFIEEGRS